MRRELMCMGLLLLTAQAAGAAEINRLDWLLGEWEFTDEQVAGDYSETGTRDCTRALDDQYILCVSKGVSNTGHQREYRWYFHYNRMEERFEMASLTSSWPRTDVYELDVRKDGRRIEVKTYTWKEGGLEQMNNATVVYNGRDRYVWEIRNAAADPDTGENPVKFRDVVTRVP